MKTVCSMSYLIIEGRRKLQGAIATQSNKNSALAILFASLMIKGKTTLVDLPAIDDVEQVLALFISIGVKVKRPASGEVVIDATHPLALEHMDPAVTKRIRASLLLWGALAARAQNYKVYKSGGCHLGERTVRPHFYALQKFGVTVTSHEKYYAVQNAPLKAAAVTMYESGDTTTENVIMAAVLSPGTTTIKMASANYMVQDLCYFLNRAGAKIIGIGSTTLVITGVKKLRPVTQYPIMPDPIAAMTFIAAAIVTGSHLLIKNCPLEFLELELCKLEVMGQKYKLKNKRQSKNGAFQIVDVEIFPSTLTALPDKIYGRPFPGLNIDNLPLFIPILLTAHGRTLVHDWAYENRAVYSLDLQKLGAHITLLDPHRLWVEGPTKFVPAELTCPPALRPAVNVLIAMLAAPGTSILRGTDTIDRGYENIYALLNKAGAHIEIRSEK